jgi:molybdopterin synthase catalytic subunit
MKIEIRSEAFNPWVEIQHYQQNLSFRPGQYGATAVFVGTMRDSNEGERVHSMSLEHYAGMTEKQLQAIATQAAQRWEILDILIIHRSGQVCPNDPIVLVAVWSAHRAAAYEANRFLMEALKSTAPFWKKEVLQDRSRWVEQNTPG